MYLSPVGEANLTNNKWIEYFTSSDNRHALPLFTSLINTVCGYHPEGLLPYNHLIWSDSKEKLVEVALQARISTLLHAFWSVKQNTQPLAYIVPDNSA